MAVLTFTNADLNVTHEINPAITIDQRIITPDGYEGFLTKVQQLDTLEGMVERGTNLVTELP